MQLTWGTRLLLLYVIVGYMAYLGFLHVQVAHKHPVLLVFCQTLIDSVYGSNIIKPIQGEISGSQPLKDTFP